MFFGEHKAPKNWMKGEGTKSVFSYGAVASHTHRPQSSFNRFFLLIILYNRFIHPPETQQASESLIRSMNTLLKNPDEMKWQIYNGWKDDGGLEKKPQSKQNINADWSPSHPLFYDVESRLFFGTWIRPKTSRTIGRKPKD